MEQETIPTTACASPMARSVDREQIKKLVAKAARTIPGVCSHCGGTDCSDETAEKVIHAFGHEWFGENWDLPRLHAAIDSADHIRWVDDPGGYDLVVLIDGEIHRFAVRSPALVKDAEVAA